MIKKHEDAGTKLFNDPNEFIECSNTMDDIYEIIGDYNSNRKKKFDCVRWQDCRHFGK